MIAVALSEVHRTAVTALLVAHIQLSRLHCLPTMAAVAEQPIVPQGQAAMAEQPIVPQGRQEESERKRKQREYESRRPKRTRANQTKVDEMATKLNEKSLAQMSDNSCFFVQLLKQMWHKFARAESLCPDSKKSHCSGLLRWTA